MLIRKAEIASMIPHTGAMCLLDGVLQWDTSTIQCVSRSHRDAHNPLRIDGRLPTLCGIEYAAQAMAVHGGLAGIIGQKPRAGYLVGLREVVCSVEYLDELEDDMIIDAEQIMGDASLAIYQFSLRVGASEVLRGRATVVLDAGGGST